MSTENQQPTTAAHSGYFTVRQFLDFAGAKDGKSKTPGSGRGSVHTDYYYGQPRVWSPALPPRSAGSIIGRSYSVSGLFRLA
jgi:hypothetical protein